MTKASSDPKWNPPNRTDICYTTGTAYEFLERMRAQLHKQMVPGNEGEPPHAPLARLNTDIIMPTKVGNEGFGMALVQSWAAVCDILSFYQERFANEGYLRTATDPRSIFELTSMLGYQPNPGLAAETLVAFTLHTVKGSPEVTKIEQGLTIGSVPPAGEMPQYFETANSLEARGAWNLFIPRIITAPYNPEFWGDGNELNLNGVDGGLKAGDELLLRGVFADNPSEAYFRLKTLSLVKTHGTKGYTEVAWKNTAIAPEHNRRILEITATTFKNKAALFGYNAMPWGKVPESTRRKARPVQGGAYHSMGTGPEWASVQGNLPQESILCLAIDPEGLLFAGVQGKGIYTSGDGGLTWQERNTGLTNRDVFTLVFDNRGGLLAGTGGGGVFYSKNNGASWEAKKGGYTLDKNGKAKKAALPETTLHCFVVFSGKPGVSLWRKTARALTPANLVSMFKPKNLLKTVLWLRNLNPAKLADWAYQQLKKFITREGERIRTELADKVASGDAFPDPDEQTFVMAGTDMGLFRTPGTLDGWHPVNTGMPRVNGDTGTAEVAVHALAFVADMKLMFAGTDHGIFYSGDLGANWRPTNKGLPRTDERTGWSHTEVVSLLVLPQEGKDSVILAGTPKGIFRSTNKGADWVAAGVGLPMVDATTGLPQVRVRQLVRSPVAPYDLYAATDYGLFISKDGGENWTQINSNLLVLQFVLRGKSRTQATFDPIAKDLDKSFLPESLRNAFEENNAVLSNFTRVEPLVPGQNWLLLDDERSTGYLVKRMGDELEVSMRANRITALAPDRQGGVVAATPHSEFEDEEWPGFWIQGNHIDLDKVYLNILPGSTLVLQENDHIEACDIVQVMTVTRADFNLESTVTRLVVAPNPDLKLFDLRTTQVLLRSTNQTVFEPQIPSNEPIAGRKITLSRTVTGLPQNRLMVVGGKRKRARIGRTGGVMRHGNEGWQRVGLPNLHVYRLVRNVQGDLIAGTSDGAFLLKERGGVQNWHRLGLVGMEVHSLGSDHFTGDIFAGVSGCEENTLFRRSGDQWTAMNLFGYEVSDIEIFQPTPEKTPGMGTERMLFVATRTEGVWLSTDHGDNFSSINVGLKDRETTCITVHPDGRFLLLGTPHGIFFSDDLGGLWETRNSGLDNLEVQSFALDLKRRLVFAATQGGVFVIGMTGLAHNKPWRPMSQGLTSQVLCDIKEADGVVYAATRGGGVFSYSDERQGWQSMPMGLSNDVRCLEIDRRRRVVAGAMAHVLLNGNPDKPPLRLIHLFDLDLERESDFVFLDLIKNTFKKNKIVLSKTTVVHRGEEPTSWIIHDGPEQRYIFYRELGLLRIYQPSPRLVVMRSPTKRPDGLWEWTLETGGGIQGKVQAQDNEVLYEPAFEEDPIVSEPVSLSRAMPTNDGKNTTLLFTEPLSNAYELDSVTILGNVVRATHGQTIRQILGSGDSTKPGQTFTLAENALTYLSQPDGGYEDTLQIHLNPDRNTDGIEWEQVDTLFDQPSGRRCYSLRRDGEGNILLHFGDGAQGARLPTGVENVLAIYRRGIGPAGNVPVDSLLMPQHRPLGLERVTNPLPGSGGAPRESWDSARARAPIQTRPLQRIVSLGDLQDFVLLYPGIAKTQAVRVWNGHRDVGHLTFAADEGVTVDRHSTTFKNLLETVFQASGKMLDNVVLASYEPMFFCIEADVLLQRGAHHSVISKAIKENLMQQYSFQQRQFGQEVTQAEVITKIQSVAGVAAVSLTALYMEGTRRILQAKLESQTARWDPKQQDIAPAQLLFIADSKAIDIKIVT